MVITHVETNGKAASTGPLMVSMVRKYYRDMSPYGSLSLAEVFNIIKNLPFRPDPEDEETLMRPYYTMNMMGSGGDCDDKAIALASWAHLNKIPLRFIAVRRQDRFALHHVYCELYIKNRWIHVDPTYSFNTLGREREPYAEYVTIGGLT